MGWGGATVGSRVSLPPLRMTTGPVQHFYSSILDAWRFSVFANISERKGFRGVDCVDFQGFLQLLTSSHLRERDKMLLRAHFVWGRLERIPSWQGHERKMFPAVIVVRGMEMGTYSGSVLLLPSCTSGSCPNLLHLCPWIVASGPDVLLWHGWLPGLGGAGEDNPWATSFGDLGIRCT